MLKWHLRFLDLADHVAQWSKDPSTKVGCVLVNDDRQVVGMGYNGFPRGVEDGADRYADRSIKYPMVVHAEANAILNAVGTTRGTIAYVTHHPCADCMGLLIQAGIRSIITHRPDEGLAARFCDSFAITKTMGTESGVPVTFLEDLLDG
ncbi:deoxycytidylate deaminase [Dinoroseobacter phage vB_DshS-R5C]|uniref:Deoxycytidylate deaminase n=1 Tax=Dinoroseobacter phage vB_DshS-R5C TaxID=1965368 RepID=A0A1V0DYA6_9CAUD|nr:deoxycytidylate deaminase [Dinoroseobacter phage vB_DshS-R5C]ARB06154.1 deoxycytidylate deaminase [Dinoroseobacter phage vB_DshS-R5C]